LYFSRVQLKNAVRYFGKAVTIDPHATMAWYNMGICYGWMEQCDSSIYCNKKVIELAPDYDSYKAFGNVSLLYKKVGNLDSASKYEILTQRFYPDFHL
jgi:tetratricopeptide (TPR) repeat protein